MKESRESAKRQSRFVLAQMLQEGNPEVNLVRAEEAIQEACKKFQPDLMIFPEMFMSSFPVGTKRSVCLSSAQHLDGPFVTGMQRLAKEHGIWIVFGMNEKVEDERNYNCVVVLNACGDIVSTYQKTHMYDAFGVMESKNNKPGGRLFVPIDTPFGKIGIFVCYEVRFPEIARYERMHGADIIIMPTAWVKGPWKSHHFRTLVTARAIENGLYMCACDLCGGDVMGESVVVDPMGIPIAEAKPGEEYTLLCADINLDRVDEVRNKVPSFDGRRPELYTI